MVYSIRDLTLVTLVTAFLLLPANCCVAEQKHGDEDSREAIQLISLRPGITLEVVDWGGTGETMVFLAGLGHTAHVFDEFAPRFTNEYRVIGITRRGFGASTLAETGYCLDTLVDDIRLVIDSLRLGTVILVGHSLGGDEMTALALKHPDKLKNLIYLDGPYDRVTTKDSLSKYSVPEMDSPEPTPAELKSPEGYRWFYERVNGVKMPVSEISAMFDWKDDGSFGGTTTPGWVYGQIMESLGNPVYDRITLPALAIYGVEYPIEELFIDFNQADSAIQSLMRARYEATKRLAALSRRRFRKRMKNARVVEIYGAGHSLYITHADRVEQVMRSFLKGKR